MKISNKKMSALMISTMVVINPESVDQKGPSKIKDPLEGIAIDLEYKLIQTKTSKLTKSMRDMVVFRHNTINTAKDRLKNQSNVE